MNQLPRPTRESLQQLSHSELVELVLMLFDRFNDALKQLGIIKTGKFYKDFSR
ncbi:MAG TPA: hypothetical protein PLE99_05850 [Candidatus Thiothrix moscowensis]|uniref:hypothetical protein n=1 Tax=unclassified Thiothrix TaxID=2636184 RepID=UPI0025CB795B|nr:MULTISPECIES: hypothetical protein [unclassified Thiothrix]HRJ52268.1 hypothetical protein [Candidatus Thiothrix moscowensis]HRJ92583.1 hypothetical protein [Candidatus Thiothrix moscowensis]